MKYIMDTMRKALNIILILLITGSVLFIYIVNPGEMMGERRKDINPEEVRNNAQFPQTIAWGNNPVQNQMYDPNDPYGIQMIAKNDNNPIEAIDPYGIQQIAKTSPNTVTTQITAVDKILQEGHWIGLEVVPLTSAIAAANNIPDGISGVLVDEVTLVAAESGIIAGDVITAVGSGQVTDLKSFKAATSLVAALPQTTVTVYRKGDYMDIMVNAGGAGEQLGIAQMEAAPMILATDVSPHGYYGPCDRCHTISKTAKNTGQLGKDAGDVLVATAPAIQWGAKAPHRDKGTCTNCHSIL